MVEGCIHLQLLLSPNLARLLFIFSVLHLYFPLAYRKNSLATVLVGPFSLDSGE